MQLDSQNQLQLIKDMKVNKNNLWDHLLAYQLAMIGKRVSDIKDDPEWYFNNTLTEIQFSELKEYAIPLIKKTAKVSLERSNVLFNWWNLDYGLRIDNKEIKETKITEV